MSSVSIMQMGVTELDVRELNLLLTFCQVCTKYLFQLNDEIVFLPKMLYDNKLKDDLKRNIIMNTN